MKLLEALIFYASQVLNRILEVTAPKLISTI